MEPNTVGNANGAASPPSEVNSIGHKYPEPPKWYRLYIDAGELKLEPYYEEDDRTESPGGFMGDSESADSSTAAEEDLSNMEGFTSEKRRQAVTTRKHGSTELSREDVTRMNRQNIFSAEQVAAIGGVDCAIAKYRIEKFYERQQEELKAEGYRNDPSINEKLMEPGKFFWTIEANAMVPNSTQLAEILLKNHVPTPLGVLGTKSRLRLSMKKFKSEVYTSGVTSRSGRGMKGMENDLQLMQRSVHLVNPNTDLEQLDPPGLHKPLVLQRGYLKKNSILKVDMKPVETTAWVKASNVKLDLEELCAVIRIHEEANDISDLANSANNDLYSSRVREKKDEINKWWFQKHAGSNANQRDQRPEHLDDAVSGQRDRSRDRGRDRSSYGRRSRSFSPSRSRTISPRRGDGHYQRDPRRTEHNQRGRDGRQNTPTHHDQAYTSGYENRYDRQRGPATRDHDILQRHRAPYRQRSPSPAANAVGYGAERDWNDRVHGIQPYNTKAFDQTYHLPGSRPFSRVQNDHAGNGNHGQYVNDPTKLQGQNQNSEPDPEISNAGLENSGGSDRLSAKRALDAQEGEERRRKRRKDRNTTEAPLNARECAKANGTAPLQAHSSDYKRMNDYETLDSAQQHRQRQGPMTNLAEDMGDAQL